MLGIIITVALCIAGIAIAVQRKLGIRQRRAQFTAAVERACAQ